MSLARANLRSADKHQLFGFTVAWYAVRGKGRCRSGCRMHLSWVSWHQEIYYVRGRFKNLKGDEKALSGKRGWCG